MLHYITLHYITLHYITLHYITLHYITLYYIILYYIIFNRCAHSAGPSCRGQLGCQVEGAQQKKDKKVKTKSVEISSKNHQKGHQNEVLRVVKTQVFSKKGPQHETDPQQKGSGSEKLTLFHHRSLAPTQQGPKRGSPKNAPAHQVSVKMGAKSHFLRAVASPPFSDLKKH